MMGIFKTEINAETRDKMCLQCGVQQGHGCYYFSIYKGSMICSDCVKEIIKGKGKTLREYPNTDYNKWKKQNMKK